MSRTPHSVESVIVGRVVCVEDPGVWPMESYKKGSRSVIHSPGLCFRDFDSTDMFKT